MPWTSKNFDVPKMMRVSTRQSDDNEQIRAVGSALLTRIPLPVKVVFRFAVTFVLQSFLLAGRTMRKRDVVVCNVVKEVHLTPVQEEACSNRVHGSIAPSFVEEATLLIQMLEVIHIFLRPQPIEVAHFEVGPLKRRSDETIRREPGRNNVQSDTGCSSLHCHRLQSSSGCWA